MNKKFLNAILCGALLAGTTGLVVSCSDYDDDINGLNQRIDAVENSLAELRSLIQGGAVVTNVESVSNGVKVTLSDGKSFTLTNGQDGLMVHKVLRVPKVPQVRMALTALPISMA